ncbi:MAG: DUF349 domain-containing protein [Flavobacteriaceae bacterium]
MEEHTLQPGAEEQKKPQKKVTTTSKVKKTAGSEKEVKKKETAPKKKEEKEEKVESIQASEGLKETKEESPVKEEKATPEEVEIDYSSYSIEALIDAYEKLANGEDWLKQHKTLQNINQNFEVKFQEDIEKQKKQFEKEGGNEIDFFFKPEYKVRFDQVSYDYRKKRRTHYKEQEASQKVNLERRKSIIEEIKKLIDQNQIDSNTYKSFRTLQESWYNTGQVPRGESQNLWETFKHHVERFYAFLHLDREFRELDYKHNYEEKLKIIERAEALQDHPDVMKASRDLNILHQQWKNDLGPVAKEHREDLWERFQKATKVIQARRQEYQKDAAGAMKENMAKKESLLKEMHKLIEELPQKHSGWQQAIKKFNSLREEFKAIGYVPAKESKASWKSFREVGSLFMSKKNQFYKEQKKIFNENIEGKKNLIQQSKKILDSDNWEDQIQVMKDLQKEWKTIGFVPRKLDNKLWKEFSQVQKEYFDRIKSGYQKLTEEQEALLKKKTSHLKNISSKKFTAEMEAMKKEYFECWEEWNAIGSLDSKNESKLNQEFSKVLMSLIKNSELDKKEKDQVIESLNTTVLQNDPKRLEKEFQNAKTNLSNLKAELTQLENNLEFFSNSSSENPLYKNVEKQINSCQNKIDQAQQQYISLKQIKNALERQAQQAQEQEENADQESSEEET